MATVATLDRLTNSPIHLGMYVGKKTNSPNASTIPKNADTHNAFFKVLSSPSVISVSPATSAERIVVPTPSIRLFIRFAIPRKNGILLIAFFGGIRVASSLMTPASSRTARAILLSPLIITPSITA